MVRRQLFLPPPLPPGKNLVPPLCLQEKNSATPWKNMFRFCISELSSINGRGVSVCDRRSPIFSGPPFACAKNSGPSLDMRKKNSSPPLGLRKIILVPLSWKVPIMRKNSGSPSVTLKKLWSPFEPLKKTGPPPLTTPKNTGPPSNRGPPPSGKKW